ncbi:MAG: hypothetical protein IJX76_04265 [Clostridia bacterium]|nr:hypothetical protein [Clostridia bacterium]
MKLKMVRIRDILGKILIVLTVIAGALLSIVASVDAITSYGWTEEMRNLDYFSLFVYDKTVEFDDGSVYETVPIPEGVNRDTFGQAISVRKYDDIKIGYGERRYLVYRDPLQTGEDVVFLLPLSDLRGFWTDTAAPFAYYAREVSAE